jgi:hypothetical protein
VHRAWFTPAGLPNHLIVAGGDVASLAERGLI